MRERHNVQTKTQWPPISPVVDGQERTANWVTLLVSVTVHRPGDSGWALGMCSRLTRSK